jgi:hypothetical protein
MSCPFRQPESDTTPAAGGPGSTQKPLQAAPVAPPEQPAPQVVLPDDYHFSPIDVKYASSKHRKVQKKEADLGVLSDFPGVWTGIGYNQIFRPNSGTTPTVLPIPLDPPAPTPPNEAILELNLTRETLSFSAPLGDIPNRGFGPKQDDIFLNGVQYVQSVDDIANPETGGRDGDPVNIHIENGMWMHVPETVDPVLPASVSRMGTIPHGTSINAQGVQRSTTDGPPPLDPVSITPFPVGNPSRLITFPSQTATDNTTARLPQDLSKFIAAGTITQELLDDPVAILRDAIKDQKITKTTTIFISTNPSDTLHGVPVQDDGTSNIAFLTGTFVNATNSEPNANALHMDAVFWIETVEYEIEVPVWKKGHKALHIKPKPLGPVTPLPTFEVKPPCDIKKPLKIKVESKQIQYSQLVNLDFGGLTWPHRSVATLAPQAPVPVPESAFPKTAHHGALDD